VWVGIGAIVTLLMGIALYGESASMKRIFFILLIVSGIVGLNLTAGGA
jgi:quaternary ammonium compound-resistance protein SugE